jgi:hypothetical protein
MIRHILEVLAKSVPLVPANSGLYQPDHAGCEKDEQVAWFPGAQDAGSIAGGFSAWRLIIRHGDYWLPMPME